jgi:hypothetical protein
MLEWKDTTKEVPVYGTPVIVAFKNTGVPSGYDFDTSSYAHGLGVRDYFVPDWLVHDFWECHETPDSWAYFNLP